VPLQDAGQTFAAVRVDPAALAKRLDRTMRQQASRSGLLVEVEGLEEFGIRRTPARGERATVVARGTLPPPFAQAAVLAVPADPETLRASARWQARLYTWGVIVLGAGVAVGVWLALQQAVGAIRQARLRSSFVATVSHDLRTPLSSMRMLAESLYLDRIQDEAKRKRFLAAILRECDRLGRLTDRALYFIRFGQDALQYHLAEGDLGRLVRNTADAFLSGFREGEVRLRVDAPEQLPATRFDAGAMEQVITNLLDNAVKYSPHDKVIDVAVGADPRRREVVVSVRDQGTGIARADLRQIFRPYYRGRRQAAATTGIGLGLALCRHIVRAHGGRIDVQSAVGAGSTFRVILPALPGGGGDEQAEDRAGG
jgi:two-component system, OmpR family, phosphate regulon sensor histidine kinase PhoR